MSIEAGPTVDGQPVAAVVEDLRDRVGELETQLEQERQEKRELQDRVEELESELEPDGFLKSMLFDLEELVTGEMGTEAVGRYFETADNADDLLDYVEHVEERVEDIERGEIDPGEVVAEAGTGPDPSDLLPVHQMYNTVTTLDPGQHDVPERKELAARVFPYFDEYAYSNEGNLVLPSTKIGDIIERELPTRELQDRLDMVDPHNETKKQVMRWIAEYGGEIFRFDTGRKQNRLIADRDAWIEYSEAVTDAAFGDGGDA